MMLDLAAPPANCIPPGLDDGRRSLSVKRIHGCISLSSIRQESAAVASRCRLPLMAGMVGVLLALDMTGPSSAQTTAALGDTPTQLQTPAPAKPMTPARMAWMKTRCSELVGFFDRYGTSRGEDTDGARNHTRIGALIECERTHYRTGIDTMAALLTRKHFGIPKPGMPAIEPEDIEAAPR